MKTSRFVFGLACLLTLAACGNKGPLILPQKPAPAEDPLPPPPEPTGTPGGTPEQAGHRASR